MIAAMILLLSLIALLQFFISYCRSLVVTYSRVPLSEEVRECTLLQAGPVRSTEFRRLLSLLQLWGIDAQDQAALKAVRVYHAFLSGLNGVWPISQLAAQWVARERDGCSHVLAVALDHRLAAQRMAA